MSMYITRAQLKEALGITDATDDGALDSAIARASAAIDGHLSTVRPGYVGFAGSSNARHAVGSNSRTYLGNGSDTLFIDDASSIASVADEDGTPVVSTAYHTEPFNTAPKRYLTYVAADWPSTSAQHWVEGEAYVVTGYFGLDTVPDDIAQAALAIAVIYWRRAQSGEPAAVAPVGMAAGTIRYGDPDVALILSGLDAEWSIPGVWGA